MGRVGGIQFKNTEETPSEMSVPEYGFFKKEAPVIGQSLWPGFEPLWLASDPSTCQSYPQTLLRCGNRNLQTDGTLAVPFLGDPWGKECLRASQEPFNPCSAQGPQWRGDSEK